MDEPGWQWPAWKFGMKRGDLFTKLHDKYNTLSTPIQDCEAFHHDVYEISCHARSKDEFHQLLSERKEQRIEELNNGLELASVKIISNPNLIGTEQWALAIQLFRERSLDALVRYFSSYLPETQYDSDADTLDSHSVHSDISRSSTTSISTASTDVHSEGPSSSPFFTEKQLMTHEPLSLSHHIASVCSRKEPLSPPASHADGDSVVSSPTDAESQHHDEFHVRHPTPSSRSMSFSGSETDRIPLYHHHDRDIMSEADTPSSLDETESIHGVYEHDDTPSCDVDPAEIEPDFSQPDDPNDMYTDSCDSALDNTTGAAATTTTAPEPPAQQSTDAESDTPTPRPHLNQASSYMSAKIAARLRRSPSPSPRARLANCEARKSPRMRRRELSPQVSRSPCEVLSRIQKPLPDQTRCRPIRGRRKVELD